MVRAGPEAVGGRGQCPRAPRWVGGAAGGVPGGAHTPGPRGPTPAPRPAAQRHPQVRRARRRRAGLCRGCAETLQGPSLPLAPRGPARRCPPGAPPRPAPRPLRASSLPPQEVPVCTGVSAPPRRELGKGFFLSGTPLTPLTPPHSRTRTRTPPRPSFPACSRWGHLSQYPKGGGTAVMVSGTETMFS